MKNYYYELGVSEYATYIEIKTAHRKLVIEWHPDKNPNNIKVAEEKFKKIQEAYDTLSNANKREVYDGELRQYRIEKKKREQQAQAQKAANEKKTTNAQEQYRTHTKSSQAENNPWGAVIVMLVLALAVGIILSAGNESGSSPA